MAELVGIVGSIVAVLQLTGTIVKYVNDVRDCSTDCDRLLSELGGAASSLQSFQGLLENPNLAHIWLASSRSLALPGGPLEQYRLALEKLATDLKPVTGWKKAGRSVVWPFRKKEMADVLRVIERQKTLFVLALQNDQMYTGQSPK